MPATGPFGKIRIYCKMRAVTISHNLGDLNPNILVVDSTTGIPVNNSAYSQYNILNRTLNTFDIAFWNVNYFTNKTIICIGKRPPQEIAGISNPIDGGSALSSGELGIIDGGSSSASGDLGILNGGLSINI